MTQQRCESALCTSLMLFARQFVCQTWTWTQNTSYSLLNMGSCLLISFMKFSWGISSVPCVTAVSDLGTFRALTGEFMTEVGAVPAMCKWKLSDTQLPCWIISRTRYGEANLINLDTNGATRTSRKSSKGHTTLYWYQMGSVLSCYVLSFLWHN